MKIGLPSNLFSVICLSLLMRLYYAASLKSIWLDEGTWIHIARKPISEFITPGNLDLSIFRIIPHIFNKMLLWATSEEIYIRFAMVLISIFSIIVFYFIVSELSGKKSALIAALLMSFSSYSIRFSAEIKYISLTLLFSLLSLFYFLKITKSFSKPDIKLKDHIFFTIFSLFTLLSDYSFLWLYGSMWFYFVYIIVRKYRNFQAIRNNNILLLGYCLSIFGFFIFFVFNLSGNLFAHHLQSDAFLKENNLYSVTETVMAFLTYFIHGYAFRPPNHNYWYSLLTDFSGNTTFSRNIYFTLQKLLFYIFLYGLTNFIWMKKKELKIALILIAFPILASSIISKFITPIFIHYNLIIVHVGLIMVSAEFIKRETITSRIYFLIYILLNTVSYYMLLKYGTFQDYRKVFEFLDKESKVYKSAVIIMPDYHFNPLEFYGSKTMNPYRFQPIPIVPEKTEDKYFIRRLLKETKKYNKLCFVSSVNRVYNRAYILITDLLNKEFVQGKKLKEYTGFEVRCFLNNSLI